jgi:hypothetical protein
MNTNQIARSGAVAVGIVAVFYLLLGPYVAVCAAIGIAVGIYNDAGKGEGE